MIDKLHPTASSQWAKGRVPGLSLLQLGRNTHEGLAEIAMGTFVAMVNAGAPLQEAVLAVYVSGLQHGTAVAQEPAA